MRGRLIIPFLADIARLDTAATATAGGYDDVFRSTKARTEMALIRLHCQVEPSSDEAQKQSGGGNLPDTRTVLVFHMSELERLGLIDLTTGAPLLRVNDRLDAIYDRRGVLARKFLNPPGMYCTESQPREYGLGSRVNLLQMTFAPRTQGRAA